MGVYLANDLVRIWKNRGKVFIQTLNLSMPHRSAVNESLTTHQRERKKSSHQTFIIKHKGQWNLWRRTVIIDTSFANRMSDAGDEIQVEAPEVEVTAEAPKGKLSVEEALQVSFLSRFFQSTTK